MFDFKFISAHNGEFLLAPRLMPNKRAVKTPVGVVHSVFKLRDLRLQSRSTLKIHAFNNDVAGAFFVPEQAVWSGSNDSFIVLRYNVRNDGKMRAVVKRDCVFAIMNVKVVRNDVLAQNEAVFKALHGYVSQHVVVVLIARRH